jgi:hypothetical protein
MCFSGLIVNDKVMNNDGDGMIININLLDPVSKLLLLNLSIWCNDNYYEYNVLRYFENLEFIDNFLYIGTHLIPLINFSLF